MERMQREAAEKMKEDEIRQQAQEEVKNMTQIGRFMGKFYRKCLLKILIRRQEKRNRQMCGPLTIEFMGNQKLIFGFNLEIAILTFSIKFYDNGPNHQSNLTIPVDLNVVLLLPPVRKIVNRLSPTLCLRLNINFFQRNE